MVELVRQKLPEVEELCRRYGVRELQLFGSAMGDEFDPERSDVDLVVDLPDTRFATYFELLEALEGVFGRKVDLLEKQAVTNPYMIRSIKARRTILYAA